MKDFTKKIGDYKFKFQAMPHGYYNVEVEGMVDPYSFTMLEKNGSWKIEGKVVPWFKAMEGELAKAILDNSK